MSDDESVTSVGSATRRNRASRKAPLPSQARGPTTPKRSKSPSASSPGVGIGIAVSGSPTHSQRSLPPPSLLRQPYAISRPLVSLSSPSTSTIRPTGIGGSGSSGVGGSTTSSTKSTISSSPQRKKGVSLLPFNLFIHSFYVAICGTLSWSAVCVGWFNNIGF
jgi:hypothetical protein